MSHVPGSGRSCGGLISKIHLASDRHCRPMTIVLTARQAADSPQFVPVLNNVRVRLPVGRPRTRPTAVAGDTGALLRRAYRCHVGAQWMEMLLALCDTPLARTAADRRGGCCALIAFCLAVRAAARHHEADAWLEPEACPSRGKAVAQCARADARRELDPSAGVSRGRRPGDRCRALTGTGTMVKTITGCSGTTKMPSA